MPLIVIKKVTFMHEKINNSYSTREYRGILFWRENSNLRKLGNLRKYQGKITFSVINFMQK